VGPIVDSRGTVTAFRFHDRLLREIFRDAGIIRAHVLRSFWLRSGPVATVTPSQHHRVVLSWGAREEPRRMELGLDLEAIRKAETGSQNAVLFSLCVLLLLPFKLQVFISVLYQ
jgi:hypothetical protein